MEQAPRTSPEPCALDGRSCGIESGPDFASRRRASSLVNPPFEVTSGALAGAAPLVYRASCVLSCLGSLVAEPNFDNRSGLGGDLGAFLAFAFASGVEFETVTESTLAAIARGSF